MWRRTKTTENLTYGKRSDLNATVLNVQKKTKAADEDEVYWRD